MPKRNKSNLIPPEKINDGCQLSECEYFKDGCTHRNPIIYKGLGGLCRSFKSNTEY